MKKHERSKYVWSDAKQNEEKKHSKGSLPYAPSAPSSGQFRMLTGIVHVTGEDELQATRGVEEVNRKERVGTGCYQQVKEDMKTAREQEADSTLWERGAVDERTP